MQGMNLKNLSCNHHALKLLMILIMFFVSQSLSKSLSITSANHATKVAENFAIDPPIILKFDGGSGDVEVNVFSKGTTSNRNYRMCNPTFVLPGGSGPFPGSFCEIPSETVVLYFTVDETSNDKTTTYKTAYSKPITVTNEIYLAYFRPKNDEKLLNDQIEDLMNFAVKSINSRVYGSYPRGAPLPGRNVIMDTYRYDSSDMSDAMKQYINMRRKSKNEPNTKACAIIGMGNNVVSQLLLPAATNDKLAVTSFRKDVSEEFSNKETYPYFNRLQLSVDVFLKNIFRFLKNRMWTSIVVIYSNTDDFYGILWSSYAEEFGIDMVKYEIAGSIRSGEEVNYDSIFDSISGSGYRIVMTTAVGEALKNLMKQADARKITSRTGYQWIGLKNENDLKFLSSNSEDWCLRTSTNEGEEKLEYCGRTFKGMIIFDNVYHYHLNSTESELIWRNFLAGEQLKAIAPRSHVYPSDYPSRGVQFALAYDALKTNILAMQRLIYKRETITGKSLSEEIRYNTNFIGMSGQVNFDGNGQRNLFIGSITTLWPVEEYLEKRIELSSRKDWLARSQSNWINSILFERKNNSDSFVEKHVMSSNTRTLWKSVNIKEFQGIYRAHIPVDDWGKDEKYSMNAIEISKCSGDYDDEHHKLVERADKGAREMAALFPKMLYECKEETHHILIIAPFYCAHGCGGKPHVSDTNKFTNGKCVRHGVCKCDRGWVGSNCSTAICNEGKGCGLGDCVAPDTCKCNPGYEGSRCNIPKCKKCGIVKANCTATDDEPNKCRSGAECIKPEDCSCDDNFYGRACSKKCTCEMANALGCNKLNGLCSACKSGYFSDNCEYRYDVYIGIIVPSVLGLLLLIFLITKIATDKIRLRKALSSNDWIVNWDEVKIADKGTSQKSSMMISAISMNTNKNTNMKQFNCATWDGIDVYYQKFARGSVVPSPNVRLEVKRVRELKHPNLTVLMGCCVQYPNVAILTELQPKGSLEDIFGNDDIRLPWNFRFGLLKGICKGLQFIHKSDIKSHGRLKSSNCLVDNRWTIKLTGFGMNHFRSPDNAKKESDYGQLLWTAPEILKSGVTCLDEVKNGSWENDVYSFGIIMSEFCTRDLPFSEVMLEKEELVFMIAGKGDLESLEVWDTYLADNNVEPGGPVRPVIKDNEWPSKYESRKMLKQLMDSCWNEKKESRPSISHCEGIFNKIDPQKGELIEHLITMLEMYSNNLENVIAKRTKQLQIESQRTEDLVSRLLPKSVSEKLKQGNPVEPENFEAVTVYFSDIVGFTSIAKASTPFEVVALLNKMYTLFDGISSQFDVYKVETIGDAYMIVSGLPTRNGDEHAAHICTTALHLMSIIGTMKIPHIDDKVLQLRAGIHTGLVVAGVVGLKMPRYCLFGDTVNVASEMESGGKPCRIQISGTTESILQRLGGYYTEYRHAVDIDSYGKLATYWLNGKEGFNEPLPAYES